MASCMASAIAHLQKTVHARLYRSSFARCPGGGLVPVTINRCSTYLNAYAADRGLFVFPGQAAVCSVLLGTESGVLHYRTEYLAPVARVGGFLYSPVRLPRYSEGKHKKFLRAKNQKFLRGHIGPPPRRQGGAQGVDCRHLKAASVAPPGPAVALVAAIGAAAGVAIARRLPEQRRPHLLQSDKLR